MKVTLQSPILTLDGNTIKEGNNPVNLAKFLLVSLTSTYPDEKNLTGEDKLKRYELALRIQNCTDPQMDISSDEIVLIKKLAAKCLTVVVYGQVAAYLEGKETGIVQK